MIKCILVTITALTGDVVERIGEFMDCDNAANYVALAQQQSNKEQVISLNPIEENEYGKQSYTNGRTRESY